MSGPHPNPLPRLLLRFACWTARCEGDTADYEGACQGELEGGSYQPNDLVRIEEIHNVFISHGELKVTFTIGADKSPFVIWF